MMIRVDDPVGLDVSLDFSICYYIIKFEAYDGYMNFGGVLDCF